ncbi:MAG: DUF4880 domain-containing protein [Methylococcaceae bacterium]|nr:DUF4880 domain-containing protein [Methylococcaceae bacterium]
MVVSITRLVMPMPLNESTTQMRERLEEEAVTWHARLASGDSTADEQAAIAEWRRLSSAHEKAYLKIAKLWDMLDLVLPVDENNRQNLDSNTAEFGTAFSQHKESAGQPSQGGATIISLHAARQSNSGVLPDRRNPPAQRTQSQSNRSAISAIARWGLGLAVAAALLLLICNTFCFDYLQHPFADYRTLIGEQSTLHLADGSTVYLNTDTALDVSLSEHERRILLLQGEAEFEVAHDKNRPFRVMTGNTTTEAIGTRFVVRYNDSVGDVTLLEGKVRTTRASAKGEILETVTLKPGDHVAFNDQMLGDVKATDLAAANAWRRGRLVMNFVALQDVVTEINRYRRGRVLLLNSDLGQRKIHVAMEINHIDDWLNALDDTLPMRVRHVGHIVLLQGQ